MDQSNTGWNNEGTTGGGGATGATGSTGGGGTEMGGGTGMGAGASMGGGTNIGGGTDIGGSSGFGVTSATDTGLCPHCGQSMNRGGLEQFLGRLGITDDMIGNLKTQFQNVDIDEYLSTAREYLKGGGSKATTYAKENPGRVAAGVAALALGAGLIYAATRERDRDRD